MKQIKLFRAFWKIIILISVFYILLSAFAIFFINQHSLQQDTNRALNRVESIQKALKTEPDLYLENSIQQLPASTNNSATQTIKQGADYARSLQGDKIKVTIPVNQDGKTLSYLSLTDERTSTGFTTVFIIGLALCFWLLTLIVIIRRSANLASYTKNIVAKIRNIERSPLTQSYLITTDEDPITAALNRLGEQIQQRILSGKETKESLYEFIEFFQFPIFVYDGKGAIHQSNAAFKNEFSDLTSIDSFSRYTPFLNFLVDKMVRPDIQDKTFYFRNINSYYRVHFNPLEMVRGRYLVIMNDVSQYHQIIQSHTDFIENVSKAFAEPLYRIENNLHQTRLENTKEISQVRKDLSWLKALVADTLLLSQPDIKQKKSNIRISQCFNDVTQNFQTEIQQKSLKIAFDISNENQDASPSDFILRIEAEKLKLILSKLLENAISYTPDNGEIILFASQSAKKISIGVRDTGAGLTAIQQSRIFERFYRTSQGKAISNGTGLGLAIVKKNVEELGGHIHVESQPGHGTCFTIHLKQQ